jgi:uncharacterized protein (TIGR03067 family)
MRLHALIALTIGLLPAAGVRADDASKKELDKLQGAWTIVSDERDGKPVAADQGARVTMSGDRFSTEKGDKVLRRGTLKLDPAKTPKTVDVTYTEGEFKGRTLLGVYNLEGDTWKICYGLPGEERPRMVPDKAGKGQVLLTLQRAKP